MNAIFVYGLLKPGQSLHHVVQPFVVQTEVARARGRLYDARGLGGAPQGEGLPAARFDEDGEIAGFVFWLDPARLDEALRILDDLEDEGDIYERRVLEATTSSGAVTAYAYHYVAPVEGRRVLGGSWPDGCRRLV